MGPRRSEGAGALGHAELVVDGTEQRSASHQLPISSSSCWSRGWAPARMAERMLVDMSQLPVEDAPGVSDAAHEAANGRVVYITEDGQRLAAIVPAEYAAALEAMNPEQAAELLEDLADGADAREALAELAAGAEPVPAEQVWAELGIDR